MTAPTPYPDVNALLRDFEARIRAILGPQFIGLYLYGSLALGDFDPAHSDIDFAAVTDGDISSDAFASLDSMHRLYAASGSAWSNRIEAAYLSRDALNHRAPSAARYPQLEKDRPFAREPLEIGWPFQRHTLREHGLIVSGPDPRTLIDPVDASDMRQAALAITRGWLDQARHDPGWRAWVRERPAQSFVVLALCRLLYSLESSKVASKPAAARWAQQALGEHWATLIQRALAGQHTPGKAPPSDVQHTIALLAEIVDEL